MEYVESGAKYLLDFNGNTNDSGFMLGWSDKYNKEIFDGVLENRALQAQKDIVIANAAFGIQTFERGEKSIEECIAIARESLESGKALATFKKFREINS